MAVETRHDFTAAGPDPLPVLRVEFAYDALSRRTGKRVYESVGGNSWVPVRTVKFAYEGWNLIAESSGTLNTPAGPEPVEGNPLRTYQWGVDLSGSRQGAGGVGGLLLITQHHSTLNIQHSTSLSPCYGDNGNIAALLDVSDPQAGVTVAASYEYGPFAEALRATGAMAQANPFRWSTKYTDEETSIVIYPLRPYSSSIGRWATADPINEVGCRLVHGWKSSEIRIPEEANRYVFVFNQPTRYVDPLGLICLSKVEVIFDAIQANDSNPLLDGVNHPPSGSQYFGHMNTYDRKGKIVRTHIVKSGGNRDPNSTVSPGDDTSTPSGNFRVGARIEGAGYPVSGTGARTYIRIHGYGLTTGCVAVRTEYDKFQGDMNDTQGEAKATVYIPMTVEYRMVRPPRGNRGNGQGGGPPNSTHGR